MKLEYKGKLSAGYYNDMEAGYPVFIDGDSLSDIVKRLMYEKGINNNFCYGQDQIEDENSVKNPLIGKKVKLTLEIEE